MSGRNVSGCYYTRIWTCLAIWPQKWVRNYLIRPHYHLHSKRLTNKPSQQDKACKKSTVSWPNHMPSLAHRLPRHMYTMQTGVHRTDHTTPHQPCMWPCYCCPVGTPDRRLGQHYIELYANSQPAISFGCFKRCTDVLYLHIKEDLKIQNFVLPSKTGTPWHGPRFSCTIHHIYMHSTVILTPAPLLPPHIKHTDTEAVMFKLKMV